MHKKWKGYFTVEASFILPLVLFLYLLIILAALFLYCRCMISQDNFLLGMRGERFSELVASFGAGEPSNTEQTQEAEDFGENAAEE